jgi:hypothetical protein
MVRRTQRRPRLRIVRLIPEEVEAVAPDAKRKNLAASPEMDALIRECRRILAELAPQAPQPFVDECGSDAEDES